MTVKRQTVMRWIAVSMFLMPLAGQAAAQDADARAILKEMSDYLAAQKEIAFKFDTVVEVVTYDMQKLQFTSSGSIQLSRPDKARVTRTGGLADIEMIFDGKTLTVLGKNLNLYGQIEAPGSLDQLIDKLRGELGVEAPGADLLLSDVYTPLIDAVTTSEDLGVGMVGGMECEHLAFRTAAVDWEIWIRTGDQPIPCRYVVTSKFVAQAPQYTIQISDWQSGDQVAASDFTFNNASGAKKVDLADLAGLDEVPVTGGAP